LRRGARPGAQRPRPALRARERTPKPWRRPAPRRRAGGAGGRPRVAAGRPGTPRPRPCRDRPGHARRRALARECPRGDRGSPTMGGRCELEPGGRAGHQGPRTGARVRRGCEMTETATYGEYGGRYVPETLIPALDELEQGWRDALADPGFDLELDELR